MSVFTSRRIAAVALAGALGFGLTACGDSKDDSKKADATKSSQQQPAAQNSQAPKSQAPNSQTGQPAADAGRKAALKAGKDDKLGAVVADGAGFTLYRFDKDTAKPSKSNCDGDCAVKWPALVTTDGNVTVDGVDKAAVGSVKRTDGTLQVTIGGWPVYRFAADTKPGETKGQGVGGTWFAVTPEGKKAGAPAAPAAPGASTAPSASTPGGGGGYSY